MSLGVALSIAGLLLVAVVFVVNASPAAQESAPVSQQQSPKWKGRSMYELEKDMQLKDLDGKSFDLAQFKGKVLVIVNVASKCGYTPQYAGLQKLYDDMKGKGVVVIGVPSNDFGQQEPGTAAEIQAFCSKNYGVTFPMLEKSQTKAGVGQSPLYEFLEARTGKLPAWNFSKYVIGKDGQPVEFFASAVKPDSAELLTGIAGALARP